MTVLRAMPFKVAIRDLEFGRLILLRVRLGDPRSG
jgi:hypothetical protein